ncbi:MAG: hypothetical protein KBE73_02760 [Fusobacteriaceae bacterium]|nr:hypothetical protein [Fusobacteriaceae bacterium]MBP9510036.1 hypothetical protein [Fusobacteriaceae bacterium]
MLLKSSILLLLMSNLYFDKIEYLFYIFFALLVGNLIFNKEIKKKLKYVKILMFFYIMTALFQIVFTQNGEVLFKIFGIYITKEGIANFGVSFLRMTNLILISWLISYKKVFTNFGKYEEVVEIVISMVPEVFILFKKRMRIKWFFRHILKEIRHKRLKNLEDEDGI